MSMRPGGQPAVQGCIPAVQAVLGRACSSIVSGRGRTPLTGRGRVLLAVLSLALVVLTVMAATAAAPIGAEAQQQFQVWRSPQFGMRLSHPTSWVVVEERADPERGDVLILGNETSALLVGLLHDTRTPRQMAEDLIQTQKEQTPDLAVVQSSETSAGSVLMFLQYTIRPDSDAAMLIDEKVLLGTLQTGSSTITLRGMVPDRANVASEFEEIESIISTLSPDH
jgi:hypothetical protein